MSDVRYRAASVLALTLLVAAPVHAQQFNSDNYLAKPEGTMTFILTAGQRNEMMMSTFSLVQNWEFTVSFYIYNSDSDATTDDGYSASLYAKYMFFENEAKNGGFAVKFGTGLEPGYLSAEDRVEDAFKSYWMNAPVTIPFFGNAVSLDLMPGVNARLNSGSDEQDTYWQFTYATRLAWYPVSPKWSVVGEIVGAEGEGTSPPEYRVGWRWEPSQHAVVAVTYDQEFDGDGGAEFEIGVMLLSPPVFCFRKNCGR